MCLWGTNTHHTSFLDFFSIIYEYKHFLGPKSWCSIDHLLVYHVDESSEKCHFSPKIGTLQKFLRSKMGVVGAVSRNNFGPHQNKFPWNWCHFRVMQLRKAPKTVIQGYCRNLCSRKLGLRVQVAKNFGLNPKLARLKYFPKGEAPQETKFSI